VSEPFKPAAFFGHDLPDDGFLKIFGLSSGSGDVIPDNAVTDLDIAVTDLGEIVTDTP
jgi:hypothetical protein